MAVSTLAYDFETWPRADVPNSRETARRFWFLLLKHANANNADSIQFTRKREDNRIWYTVNGVGYELVPAPDKCHRLIIGVGRDLLAGGAWRGWLWGRVETIFPCSLTGEIVVIENDHPVTWTGVVSPTGIAMRSVRVSSTATA